MNMYFRSSIDLVEGVEGVEGRWKDGGRTVEGRWKGQLLSGALKFYIYMLYLLVLYTVWKDGRCGRTKLFFSIISHMGVSGVIVLTNLVTLLLFL
jgi:hypothetical protein